MANAFANYEELVSAALAADEADPHGNAFYASITNAISQEARGQVVSRGRYSLAKVEKVERELRVRFVELVNEYRDGGVSFNGVADLILGLDSLAPIAWAVAQRLPR